MPHDVPEQDADVVLTDEDRIAYWKGAYDRMAALNGDLSRQIEAYASRPKEPAPLPSKLPEKSKDLNPLGYLNIYKLRHGELVIGSTELYHNAEEAENCVVDEYDEHMGLFAILPLISIPPSEGSGEEAWP